MCIILHLSILNFICHFLTQSGRIATFSALLYSQLQFWFLRKLCHPLHSPQTAFKRKNTETAARCQISDPPNQAFCAIATKKRYLGSSIRTHPWKSLHSQPFPSLHAVSLRLAFPCGCLLGPRQVSSICHVLRRGISELSDTLCKEPPPLVLNLTPTSFLWHCRHSVSSHPLMTPMIPWTSVVEDWAIC